MKLFRTGTLLGDAAGKIKKDRLALLCFLVIVGFFLISIFVQWGWLAGHWGDELGASYASPSLDSWRTIFGLDIFGRSVLEKALQGVRVAMIVGLFSALVAVLVGVTLGSIAGYFGGKIDDLVVWFYTTIESIPSILLLMGVAWMFERGLASICFAIGITSWVRLCRVIRGEFIKHKGREYVVAAEALGLSHGRRIFRHILPNVSHQVIISFSMLFQSAIKSEVVLSYLGLGAPGMPSWGMMIDDARLELSRGVWWQLSAATGFMFLIVLALNLFGDALRDALDPKL